MPKNRRRNQPKQRRSRIAVRSSRQPSSKVHSAATSFVCGMFDPFCKHSLNAKVPSEGSFRSVSVNISDFNSLSASQDATTSGYYINHRVAAGIEDCIGTCTMDNGVTTVVSPGDSSWATTLGTANNDAFRAVATAVRFQYTGPQLSAQGYWRIMKTGRSNDITDVTNTSLPISPSNLSGLYWDYSCQDMAKEIGRAHV